MIRVLPLWHPDVKNHDPGVVVVSTVSKNSTAWKALSPFILGPCELYDGMESKNMENAWQFSKVYPEMVKLDRKGEVVDILPVWYRWSKGGFADEYAHRYPMGKGAKPLFSYWKGECLKYIDARKVIYGPLYAEAVQKTTGMAWCELVDVAEFCANKGKDLFLLDYDAYDHHKLKMSLTDVLNCPTKKMGHAFVLMMLLTKDAALKQLELR